METTENGFFDFPYSKQGFFFFKYDYFGGEMASLHRKIRKVLAFVL